VNDISSCRGLRGSYGISDLKSPAITPPKLQRQRATACFVQTFGVAHVRQELKAALGVCCWPVE
jgi:hypothetical protein